MKKYSVISIMSYVMVSACGSAQVTTAGSYLAVHHPPLHPKLIIDWWEREPQSVMVNDDWVRQPSAPGIERADTNLERTHITLPE